MNQMLTSQANFSRTFLRGKATDVFSSRVLIFRGYQAVPKYPAVERPGRSPEYRTKHRLSVLQDTATDQMAVIMQPTVTNIDDDGQAKQRALAVLVAAFIEIVALMPLDTGVHWLGTIDLIYSTIIADLNEKRQANIDVSFADITAANLGTFGADEPMAAFWTDFVDMANVIFAKIAMEYVNHPGIAEAMANEAKSAKAMAALLSSDRLKALMSEHFQELVAETRDIAREKLGITEPPLNEDEALQARQDAAQQANEVAEELENDDGSLSDDAMAGTGNQQVRGLDEDDPDEPTAPKSKVELLLIAINHHAQANVAGDWTTQHVMAITAAITSAPPAATSPYCPKRLLQYIATHTASTAWTEHQRQLIRWLVRKPEASPEQLAEYISSIRTRAENRAKANLLPSHKALHQLNKAYGTSSTPIKLRFHHSDADTAMRIRITKAFQTQSAGGFADKALVATSRSLQKAVKESAKTATATGDNTAAIGAAVAS